MQTDAHFVISHNGVSKGKPCQDYAASGTLRDHGAFAVVSDGCSSGGQTDLGAKLVTSATAKSIQQHWKTFGNPLAPGADRWITTQSHFTARQAQQNLGLTYSDMEATALYAYATPEGGYFFIKGDGVIAWAYPSGKIVAIQYEWAKNTPYYQAYHPEHDTHFIEHHGGDAALPAFTSERWEQVTPHSSIRHVANDTFSIEQGMNGVRVAIPDGVQCAAVFTDGIAQISHTSWPEAVASVMETGASTAGRFAVRQLNWTLRLAAEFGNYPMDDVGCAMIQLRAGDAK